MKRTFLLLTLLFLGVFAGVSFAQSSPQASPQATPSEVVEAAVNKVRETVIARQGKISEKLLTKKLEKIIEPVFDFKEMSRRCLGVNWKKANPEQQKEFMELFSRMLSRNYLKKVRDNIADSKFTTVGGTTKRKKALVKTIVEHDDQKFSINYRLRLKKDRWRVYDVIVENIGLVSNYRSEFAGIVRKEKMEGLLTRLRKKNEGYL